MRSLRKTIPAFCFFLLLASPVLSQFKWYRGNTHCHSKNSDGLLTPNQIAQVYRNAGYDFLAITDHSSVTKADVGGIILYASQELTGYRHVTGFDIHYSVDADNLGFEPCVGAILAQNGTPILNHPTLSYMQCSVAEVVRLKPLNHMEIYNAVVQFGRGFDDQSFWDQVLSSGKRIFGVAADDAHELGDCCRAWIMVYAYRYERETILAAFNRGHYYASTGVYLDEITVQPGLIRIKSRNGDYIRFIGEHGATLDSVYAAEATYSFTGREGYIRAVAGDTRGHKAWTQPLIYYNFKQPCLVYISGDNQEQRIKQPLSSPLVLQTKDLLGNILSRVPVTFRTIKGSGHFGGKTSVEVVSGPDGMVAVTPTLGTEIGDSTQIFSAQVSGVPLPRQFFVRALPEKPGKLAITTPPDQKTTVRQVLSGGLSVAITDSFGNGCPYVPVIFKVQIGDAQINGAGLDTLITDAKGVAKATLLMGQRAGEVQVRVNSPLLPGVLATYRTFSVPDQPAWLSKISGDEQYGTVNTPLAAPYVVAVTDSFGNPIANHPVSYNVTSGDGKLNQASLSTKTDAEGKAQAFLILGPKAFFHQVTVTSSHNGHSLRNSPITFHSILEPGPAHVMMLLDGDQQIGLAGEALAQPLQIKILDDQNHPVPNHAVIFKVISAGAHFGGKDTLHCRTDFSGIAKATPILGSGFGVQQYLFEAISYVNTAGPLLPGAPVRFTVRVKSGAAKSLVPVSKRVFTDSVQSRWVDSLYVRIYDTNQNPVAGYPVHFNAIQGSAYLNGRLDSTTVISRSDGLAAVGLSLPTKTGRIVIQAFTDFQSTVLAGSPCDFTFDLLPGAFNARVSQFRADTLVVADGHSEAHLSVRVLDTWHNPLPGRTIELKVDRLAANLKTDRIVTDAQGFAETTLISTVTGTADVWATVSGERMGGWQLHVQFIAGPPQQVILLNDGQAAQYDAILPESVGVLVRDVLGNPVPDVPIRFFIQQGDGALLPGSPVVTDSAGYAFLKWRLGAMIGEQKVAINVPGLTEIFYISAHSCPIPAGGIQMIAGDLQIGLIEQELSDSLIVAVVDGSGRPAMGHDVFFTLQGTGPTLAANRVTTNTNGQAGITVKTGAREGAFQIVATVSGMADSVRFQFRVLTKPTIFLTPDNTLPPTARPEQTPLIGFRVLDAFARPLANEMIAFSLVQGKILPQSLLVASDEQGRVRYAWRLGHDGLQSLRAWPAEKAGNELRWEIQIINTPPQIDLPAAISGTTNHLLAFTVRVSDAEQDSIALSALNLPSGCTFSDQSEIRWQPLSNQQGDYLFSFIACDSFGAADTAFVSVHIDHIHNGPEIISYQPADSVLQTLYYRKLNFSIDARDDDCDSLRYHWCWNGLALGDSKEISILSTPLFPTENIIIVTVSDTHSSRQKSWHVVLSPTVVDDHSLIGTRNAALDWELVQNFPNPFNAFTQIAFSLPQPDHVRIKVLDLTGKEQALLLDQYVSAGRHQVQWDASGYTSGVYILSFQSSSKRNNRKMMLVR